MVKFVFLNNKGFLGQAQVENKTDLVKSKFYENILKYLAETSALNSEIEQFLNIFSKIDNLAIFRAF